MASSVASAPAAEDWPRPSNCPAPQDENARWIEAGRAERCKRRTESLHCRDVVLSDGFVLYVDPRARFFVVNKPAGMYVENVLDFIERYMEEVRRAPERHSERSKRAKIVPTVRLRFARLSTRWRRLRSDSSCCIASTGTPQVRCRVRQGDEQDLVARVSEGVKKHYGALPTRSFDDSQKKEGHGGGQPFKMLWSDDAAAEVLQFQTRVCRTRTV